MFGRRRRSKGFGLTGILAAGAALYFTGAGKWLWEQTGQLENQCFSVMARMGTNNGAGLCAAIGKGYSVADNALSSINDKMQSAVESVRNTIQGNTELSSSIGDIVLPSSFKDFSSSSDALLQKLRLGPDYLADGSTTADRIRAAFDGFQIGNRFMAAGGASSGNAIPWFQKGAQVQGYGLLSQLSLGDIYSQGTPAVAADPAQAIQYYAQAHQSISLLQQANTPQAQQLLAALPASPNQIQQQLLAAIRQLKGK